MATHVRGASKVITVVPTLDTSAYASADTLFLATAIPNAVLDTNGTAVLESVIVVDIDNQKQAIDLVFFDITPASSYGAANAAYALVDADSINILGRISILAADYVSSSTTNAEATVKNIGLLLQAAAKSRDIYVVGVCRSGTPTYTAAGLKFRFGLLQD
jgi:hypothetical protein